MSTSATSRHSKYRQAFDALCNATESEQVINLVLACCHYHQDDSEGEPSTATLADIARHDPVQIAHNATTVDCNEIGDLTPRAFRDVLGFEGNAYDVPELIKAHHQVSQAVENIDKRIRDFDENERELLAKYNDMGRLRVFFTFGALLIQDFTERIEAIHRAWKEGRVLVDVFSHPLVPIVRAWLQEQTTKHVTAETERKRPAATLPMKSAARVRNIFVESAETEIAASPPPAAQLMLPTLETKQHLPEILPLEILQGIPLQTQGRQQVSMAVRLFFEGVMMLNPKQHKGAFEKSLGELVADLHPETDRIQKRDINRVVKGTYLLDQIRIPYVDPVGGPGRFKPIRAWNEPAHGANKDFLVKFYVEFPSDDKGGMLVIKSILRRLGQVSPSQLNAYLAACWIFNRHGRSPKNVLIDPTMPDPDSARNERGVLLHPETHRPILDDKGKGVKDIYYPAAVKVLDRVGRDEASAYPVLSFDELTRACYPGVDLNKTNKAKYHQDAMHAWDELEQRGIIRVIRHADGYQILPSSEHLNLHRAIRKPS